MTSLDSTARVELAAEFLCIPLADAQVNQKDLPEMQATYFWASGRGGSALVVGEDGGMLFANSSVTSDAHSQAFVHGRRTDPTSPPPSVLAAHQEA